MWCPVMPNEPSLSSLERSLRQVRLMVAGLAVMILLAVIGVLREVYRVEKEVNALEEKVAGSLSNEVGNLDLEKLDAWAKQLNAKPQGKEFVASTTSGKALTPLRRKPDEDIAAASVIVLTKWQREGTRWKCVVEEVLRESD